MTEKEQIANLEKELDTLISRYANEYDLCYASVIGVLQLKIHGLCTRATDDSEENLT